MTLLAFVRFFSVRNPNTSESARKQFNGWNSLLLSETPAATSISASDSSTGSSKVLVAPQLKQQTDGSYLVSVYDVTVAIVRLAGSERFSLLSQSNHDRLILLFTLCLMLIPFLSLAAAQHSLSFYSPWFYCFLLSSSFLIWTYSIVYFRLFFVIIFDVRRQETMNALLGAMIRLTDLDPETRDILTSYEEVNLHQLARDNVAAIFSVSRGIEKELTIRGADCSSAPAWRGDVKTNSIVGFGTGNNIDVSIDCD